jgi:2-aminobenzoate-CoA ligase
MHVDTFVHDQLPPQSLRPQLIYDNPDLQFAANVNCVKALFDQAFAKGYGDHVLLRSPNRQLTYQQTYQQVISLAGTLQGQGLVPGNRVLLRGANSIGMAIAWLAVAYCGMVVVATMPLLRAKELTEIINKAKVATALCDEGLVDELQLAKQSSSVLKNIHRFSAHGEFAFATGNASFDTNQYQPDTDDICLLAFTSGTTGTPKAAAHSHRDILAACYCWPKHCLQAKPSDIVVGSPPLAFTFGLGGMLLFPLFAGCSVYYHDKPYTPETMADTINQVGATISYTAPTFYRLMLPFVQTRGTGSLRLPVSAGEALPYATRQAWQQATGIDLLDGIGATELFHIFISSHPGDLRAKSLGKVVPGYQARIVDQAGNDVPAGTVGRLAVRGPTGCKYLGDPRQTHYVKDGWNYPGDTFYCDADGYYFYQARADDMIITAGYNVAGPEVESCLLQHPTVAECAVIGEPDEERGMIIKAFVVPKSPMVHNSPEALGTSKELQDWVKHHLAPYKYPRAIEFVTHLPKTETGKLQRYKLRTEKKP